MIRFPKRNVAQPAPKKPKESFHIVPKEEENKPVVQKSNKPSCPGAAWNDRLYPSELWQMHDDLDKITYGKLTPEERTEIIDRLNGSLAHAEAEADKQLFSFVQETVNSAGIETYANMLKKAMTFDAQALLALRCYIASTSRHRIKDTITLYSNRGMNSIDFFPDSCRSTMVDPKTGKKFDFVSDRPENADNPYWRAKNHSSSKHRAIKTITTDPDPTARDIMPSQMTDQMVNILAHLGIKVDSHEDAWLKLSAMSKNCSIEDRIVARIAYLIMNATVRKGRITGIEPRLLK